MVTSAGWSHLPKDEFGEKVEWSYDTAENVLISVGEGDNTDTVISIDPEDLLAIADAVRGKMKRDLEDEPDRIRAYKEKRKY